MTTITVPKGDYGYAITFVCHDSAGSVVNLTGYTVTFKYWRPGVPGTVLISGVCTIDSAPNGTCHYIIVEHDFDTVGRYSAELEMTKAGVVESFLPFEISVEESG